MTQTLQERMVELMTATGWTVGEIARIAGVTSAAVSQWVGNGTGKQSKSIGNINAAMKLEKASGFSALWLAQGKGQKLAVKEALTEETRPEPDALYKALEVLSKVLTELDEEARSLVGHSLARLAQDPSKLSNISQIIRTLVFTNATKSHANDTGGRVSELPDLPRGIEPEDGEHLPISRAQRGRQK